MKNVLEKDMNPDMLLKTEQLYEIVQPLLRWYHSQARILPWREDPTPYRVWISEIMLQQTRVEAVKPYFEHFITALPTIKDLADVPLDSLLKLWEGLGYYTRARNLQKAAQQIVACFGGTMPNDYNDLLSLPGVGRYTAGAISSIAFGQTRAAVDGNVLRVISRILAYHEDIMSAKVKLTIEQKLENILPAAQAGDFNQALMELGAMICLPKAAAKCPLCPLKQLCLAMAQNIVPYLPVKKAKKARRIEKRTILLFVESGRTALMRRPAAGLLASMWELPNLDGHIPEKSAFQYARSLGLIVKSITVLPAAKHVFSHVEWHMIGYQINLNPARNIAETKAAYATTQVAPLPQLHWAAKNELHADYAIPTAFKAYIDIFTK
ncbi:A/G-specific adenine glycosylase [Propionispira raffinosivorans]|uniref:A/G-specific adenine glycosylase n=1 Tax=Propionispira raffinosivorans TaxID=86959 RepID=UPI000379E672|nr:A/G-specific adenine glycosylase [Propionispira raffinosivorans]